MEPEQPTRPVWLDQPEVTPTEELPAPPPMPPAPPTPPSPPNPLPAEADVPAAATGWLKPAIAGAVVGALVAAGVAGGIVAATKDDNTSTVRSASPVVTRQSAQLGGSKLDVASVLDAVEKGVVAINVQGTATNGFNSGTFDAAGSGMVIDSSGLVLTNAHVVSSANKITVTLYDGRNIDADLVGASSTDDVALIRLRDTSNLSPVKLGDSDKLQVGDSVVAVGNALNLGATPTVTTGIVSALNRSLDAENNEHLEKLIQTDAAINHGNSGGPLVDATGAVIGVNTAIASEGQNIGFALSINQVKTVIDSLRNGGGDKATAFLGVNSGNLSDVSQAVRDRLNIDGTSGAFVQQVVPGTAAERAGLEAGDVIVGVDNTTVKVATDLTRAILAHKPGDKVTIHYQRDGATHTTTATLGSRAAGTP